MDEARRQQLQAVHNRRSYSYQRRSHRSQTYDVGDVSGSGASATHSARFAAAESLKDYPVDKGGHLLLHNPLRFANETTRDVVKTKADMKDMKKRAKKNRRSASAATRKSLAPLSVEYPRDAGDDGAVAIADLSDGWMESHIQKMKDFVFEVAPDANAETRPDNFSDDFSVSSLKYEKYKDRRFDFFMTRRAIEKEPSLLAEKINAARTDGLKDEHFKKNRKLMDSPGVYSLHVEQLMGQKKLTAQKDQMLHEAADLERIRQDMSTFSIHRPTNYDQVDIEGLMAASRRDEMLIQQLLYDPQYDNKWKSRYTDEMLHEDSVRRKKPNNSAGWVLPLKKICDNVGIDSAFFTDNSEVDLADARAHVLYTRFTSAMTASDFIMSVKGNGSNPVLDSFFEYGWDGRNVLVRFNKFLRFVESDRDRVRVHGQYYNNIYLGKRMFGPGRKQMFVRTMVGGMERRFEILDNQVNHIPFSHEAFDRNLDKCRLPRVKCRDSTRVVLHYNVRGTKNDFIHANYVRGGPLFNEFIITQAPMQETIYDFWRMVWQERSPYIFMLISRKDKSRCAEYYPRHAGEKLSFGDLEVVCQGEDKFRSPLFVVTQLVVFGPSDQELHVEHWQGDMNNSDNLAAPLQLLQLARSCSYPTIVHCHLGISRSAVLVAIEICIAILLRGPFYKYFVQKAVQLLRSQRAFAVETPMQYIFIHRVLMHFVWPFVGAPTSFKYEYSRWMKERAQRPFIDDVHQQICPHRLLSPRVDPDLLVLARHRERPDYRRETHDCVGQLPIPLMEVGAPKPADGVHLPKKYPRGNRYP